MNKKLLFITKYLEDSTTVGYRHSNIIKHWTSSFDIDLLNFESSKKKIHFFRKVINKFFIYPDIYFFNLFNYKKEIRKKLNQNKYDLVFIGVLPFSFLNLASYIKKKEANLKIILDMTDPLTANVSYYNGTFFHKNFIKLYEKKHFKNIDTLIVLNEEIKTYYQKKYNFLKNIIVIEQGTNPLEINENREKENKILELFYAGMFYKRIREPFMLYDAVENYTGNIRLSIFGSFKKIFLPPINERFYYGGIINRTLLHKKINETDIIVFLDNFFGLQIPGKIIENLATNKPILFIYENEKSPTLTYLKDQEGVFISLNEPNEIKNQIDNIAKFKNRKFHRNVSKYYWENLVKRQLFLNADIIN